ncbi:peroxisome membrane protein [Ramicandelaber brevisporus]|nr:peroxisome membrane protein [Ramicandelaber brevisporus]KAI8868367.1 peroxisome membrane protein [Ramicandelaber brevisporus]
MPVFEALAKYERFILQNASKVSSIESTIRTITYVLPGRFDDAELVSEVLYALLNLLGLYHDSILAKAADAQNKVASALGSEALARILDSAATAADGSSSLDSASHPLEQPPPSPFNRYTRFWLNASGLYRRVALILTLVQTCEAFLEMIVQKKWGQEAKWRFVTTIEALKVLCRLAQLRLTSGRMVLNPPHPERDIDPASLRSPAELSELQHRAEALKMFTQTNNHSANKDEGGWKGNRTDRKYDSLETIMNSQNGSGNGGAAGGILGALGLGGLDGIGGSGDIPGDVSKYLSAKAILDPETVMRPMELVRKLGSIGKVGELLFIIRPLLYVLVLRKYGNKSWIPWLISLAIELSSRAATIRELSKPNIKVSMTSGEKTTVRPARATTPEKAELKRRLWLFAYYLLRSPLYELWTRQKLDGFIESAGSRAFIGMFAGFLQDYKPLWENVYFYTSGS